MDRGVAVLLTAVVGGLIALQAPINSLLGHRIGTFQAAVVSFTVGTLALAAIALLSGGLGSVAEVRSVPWYYLLGGLLGAAYVTSVLVTVRSLGAGGVTAAVVVDQLGILGVHQKPITLGRAAGIALLAVGTFLVVRE